MLAAASAAEVARIAWAWRGPGPGRIARASCRSYAASWRAVGPRPRMLRNLAASCALCGDHDDDGSPSGTTPKRKCVHDVTHAPLSLGVCWFQFSSFSRMLPALPSPVGSPRLRDICSHARLDRHASSNHPLFSRMQGCSGSTRGPEPAMPLYDLRGRARAPKCAEAHSRSMQAVRALAPSPVRASAQTQGEKKEPQLERSFPPRAADAEWWWLSSSQSPITAGVRTCADRRAHRRTVCAQDGASDCSIPFEHRSPRAEAVCPRGLNATGGNEADGVVQGEAAHVPPTHIRERAA